MERHRFGIGDYRYFARPLPEIVERLRSALYERLAPIANGWMEALRSPVRFPDDLASFLASCRAAGQARPTPLLLHYEEGGYNALHQDLYGPVTFPLQVAIFLSRPGVDYDGGAFLLVEQRPRAQSVGEAITIPQGHAIVFATRDRPVAGKRGHHRAAVRHGVSRLLRGRRLTLGIIFHDAK
ncbi:MAG: 2OG-Fe(II) oxygenase [Acidobacteriota bacterium]